MNSFCRFHENFIYIFSCFRTCFAKLLKPWKHLGLRQMPLFVQTSHIKRTLPTLDEASRVGVELATSRR